MLIEHKAYPVPVVL